MKRMTRLLAMLLCLLMALMLLTSCGGPNIVGEWKLTDVEGHGEFVDEGFDMLLLMGGELTLEFDKKVITLRASMWGETKEESTEYQIKDGKLITEGSELTITVEGDRMTLSDGSGTMILTRK